MTIPTIHIGPLALPTYPLLALFGVYFGIWLAAKVATRRGLNPDELYNVGFFAALAALVAGRLGHVIRYASAYLSDPLSILSPNLSALEPLAAALAVVIVLIWYQRRRNVPIRPLLDALAMGVLGAMMIFALADGINARNFGEPTLLPWGIAQWNVQRHPVQFYEAGLTALALALIWWRLPKLRPGHAALAALGSYAAIRLFVDAFRNTPALVGDGFRLSQVVALVVILLALLIWYQDERNPEPANLETEEATS